MSDLTAIPTTITAGDSYALTLSLSDYPATSGWSVELALVGPSVETVTSTASGDAHALALTTVVTAALEAGVYAWRLKAMLAPSTAETFQTGTLEVQPDLASLAVNGVPRLAYWTQLKAAAETALLTIMEGGAVQQAMIMGRSTQFRSPDDCLRIIAQCNAQIQTQRSGSFGRVPVTFSR